MDIAYISVPDKLCSLAESPLAALLRAYLQNSSALIHCVCKNPTLLNSETHRFFNIYVFTGLNSLESYLDVPMVRSADCDGVDIRPCENFLIIFCRKNGVVPNIIARLIDGFDLLLCRLQTPAMDVAKRQNLGLLAPRKILAVPFGDQSVANYGHVYFAVWRNSSAP